MNVNLQAHTSSPHDHNHPPSTIMQSVLSTYLQGSTSTCPFRDHISTQNIHLGIPQGSVIYPTIFNFYYSDFPHSVLSGHVSSNADNFTIATSSPFSPLVHTLNSHLDNISTNQKHLAIALSKFHSTLFTSDTCQSSLHPDQFFKIFSSY